MNDVYDKILSLKTNINISKMIAKEMFETLYGVYNHEVPDPNNPFPLITRRDNNIEDWGLKNAYARLLALDAPNKCGKSIDAILDMETHDYSLLIESLEAYNKSANEALNNLPK